MRITEFNTEFSDCFIIATLVGFGFFSEGEFLNLTSYEDITWNQESVINDYTASAGNSCYQ